LTEVVNRGYLKKGDNLITKFMSLEPEKRQRIIDAGLEEFAQRGYKNASTNEIVKKAEISKGLLFHYFSNKKGLFLFLYDYAWDIFLNDFYSKINLDETDIIKRLKQIILLKIELIQKHPDLYNFIVTAIADDSVEIKAELENKYKSATHDGFEKLFSGIDTSKFKEGLNIRRVLDILMWISQGISNRELERIKHDPKYKAHYDIKAIIVEVDEYIEMYENAFYK
jgi:TetR/AcrR family transcriptional regulator